MRKEEKASISIMKIICVSIILILISGIGVMAVNTKLNDIKITLQNGYEMTVLTSKTKVSDILEENNIILEENQKTIPDIDSEVTSGQNIQIILHIFDIHTFSSHWRTTASFLSKHCIYRAIMVG